METTEQQIKGWMKKDAAAKQNGVATDVNIADDAAAVFPPFRRSTCHHFDPGAAAAADASSRPTRTVETEDDAVMIISGRFEGDADDHVNRKCPIDSADDNENSKSFEKRNNNVIASQATVTVSKRENVFKSIIDRMNRSRGEPLADRCATSSPSIAVGIKTDQLPQPPTPAWPKKTTTTTTVSSSWIAVQNQLETARRYNHRVQKSIPYNKRVPFFIAAKNRRKTNGVAPTSVKQLATAGRIVDGAQFLDGPPPNQWPQPIVRHQPSVNSDYYLERYGRSDDCRGTVSPERNVLEASDFRLNLRCRPYDLSDHDEETTRDETSKTTKAGSENLEGRFDATRGGEPERSSSLSSSFHPSAEGILDLSSCPTLVGEANDGADQGSQEVELDAIKRKYLESVAYLRKVCTVSKKLERERERLNAKRVYLQDFLRRLRFVYDFSCLHYKRKGAVDSQTVSLLWKMAKTTTTRVQPGGQSPVQSGVVDRPEKENAVESPDELDAAAACLDFESTMDCYDEGASTGTSSPIDYCLQRPSSSTDRGRHRGELELPTPPHVGRWSPVNRFFIQEDLGSELPALSHAAESPLVPMTRCSSSSSVCRCEAHAGKGERWTNGDSRVNTHPAHAVCNRAEVNVGAIPPAAHQKKTDLNNYAYLSCIQNDVS